MTTPHLGVWLVTLGFITKRQLAQALETEMVTKTPFAEVLAQRQVLSQEAIAGAEELQDRLARTSTLADVPIPADVLQVVPSHIATREKVLPLSRIGDRLVVAYARTRTRHEDVSLLLDQIGQQTGLLVHGIPFPQEDVERAVSAALEPLGLVNRAVQRVVPGSRAPVKQAFEVAGTPEDHEAPIIELVNQILAQGVERGASDLHIRPCEHALEVNMRLDGVIQPLMELPKEVEAAVVSRLKVMADLNISERRRPQDGRVSIQVAGKPVDLRVACIASHWGEMMVLRILRPLNIPDGFASLGFGPVELERWRRIIQAPNGLILVTGPTGSGKTSTLYATLNQFDRREKNLITVEDPVEYPVSGIGQIQIATQAGLTFAAALRSILRLDPDVILVGEIRDHETLMIALEAAQTGHLVLSTLHTNDAVAAISRMVEMGAPRHMIASTFKGVLAQRLVRRVCPLCVIRRPATPEEAGFLGLRGGELAQAVGCDACNGIGYKGRMGVYEVLEGAPGLADLITAGHSTQELWREARRLGMRSLLEDGKAKAATGSTTVHEVQRVLGVSDWTSDDMIAPAQASVPRI